MKNTIKTIPTLFIGSVIIALNLLIFFLGTSTPREYLDWWGLVFVFVSELVLIASSVYLLSTSDSSSKRIFKTGIASTLMGYWFFTVILALFRDQFIGNDNYFLLINFLIIGIAAIISVLLNSVASRVQMLDSTTLNARLFIQDIDKILFTLKTNDVYSKYKTELSSIYDKVQFSDKVGKTSYDLDLSNEVENLETILNGNAEDTKAVVEKSISKILFFINQRNMELRQSKRGDF